MNFALIFLIMFGIAPSLYASKKITSCAYWNSLPDGSESQLEDFDLDTESELRYRPKNANQITIDLYKAGNGYVLALEHSPSPSQFELRAATSFLFDNNMENLIWVDEGITHHVVCGL